MIFFVMHRDQTQRNLTRQRQKLMVTVDDELFTTPEPPRRPGWTGFAKQIWTDFGKRFSPSFFGELKLASMLIRNRPSAISTGIIEKRQLSRTVFLSPGDAGVGKMTNSHRNGALIALLSSDPPAHTFALMPPARNPTEVVTRLHLNIDDQLMLTCNEIDVRFIAALAI